MFASLFQNTAGSVSTADALICMGVSILCGILIACFYMFRNQYTKSFVMTLALLPVIVQVVILMVNGNLGAGVAVAGSFSLIRFRSAPGTSREICAVFFAMAVGLATGMGYPIFAVAATLIIGIFFVLLGCTKFGEGRATRRTLKITIPENLDYMTVFDDIFSTYLKSSELQKVKTTNLGSLYELTYTIELRAGVNEKEFLDQIRCRNGNLNVLCGRPVPETAEL